MIEFEIKENYYPNVPSTSGVYRIYFKNSNKFYYGSTSNFRIRFNEHKRNLINNTHVNYKLKKEFYHNKDCYFQIIEETTMEERTIVEQRLLNENFNNENCLNIAPEVGTTTGIPMPENVKQVLKTVCMTREPWNKKNIKKTYSDEKRKTISETLRRDSSGSKTKLTWELAREIRQFYKDNYGKLSMRDIGKLYSIDCSQISRIVNNITWREIDADD